MKGMSRATNAAAFISQLQAVKFNKKKQKKQALIYLL